MPHSSPRKIAIFCPNWVGDLVMATPAMRAVRTEYPAAEVVAVLRPYVAEVLSGLDLVDRTLLHHPRGRDAGLRGWNFARTLRREQFDLALLLPNSLRSAAWAWMSGASRRVGYARNGRSCLLTDAIPAGNTRTPRPAIDEYLRLAEHLGCHTRTREMELATLPVDEQRLDDYWRRNGLRSPEDVVCFNSGGAFGAAKHWPVSHFAELARRIAWKLDRRVLVLCGPSEREPAREIVRLANHPAVTSLANEDLSLGLTKAAVRRARLLVTTDSGPRHFAPPFGVPVVTLFGPTHQAWSETFYSQATALQLAMDCGPCQKRTCPLKHHRCMQDLDVERVFRAVAHVLDSSQPQRHVLPGRVIPGRAA